MLPIFVMLAVLLLSGSATAHDHSRPDLDNWFKGLQNKVKTLCCDGSDGLSLNDPDWRTADGKYQVRLEDGVWYDVPDEALVTEPNKLGIAKVWPVKYPSGFQIRCFMPGPGA